MWCDTNQESWWIVHEKCLLVCLWTKAVAWKARLDNLSCWACPFSFWSWRCNLSEERQFAEMQESDCCGSGDVSVLRCRNRCAVDLETSACWDAGIGLLWIWRRQRAEMQEPVCSGSWDVSVLRCRNRTAVDLETSVCWDAGTGVQWI